MKQGRRLAAALGGMLLSGCPMAQEPCHGTAQIQGTVSDPTGAVIPGAAIRVGSDACLF